MAILGFVRSINSILEEEFVQKFSLVSSEEKELLRNFENLLVTEGYASELDHGVLAVCEIASKLIEDLELNIEVEFGSEVALAEEEPTSSSSLSSLLSNSYKLRDLLMDAGGAVIEEVCARGDVEDDVSVSEDEEVEEGGGVCDEDEEVEEGGGGCDDEDDVDVPEDVASDEEDDDEEEDDASSEDDGTKAYGIRYWRRKEKCNICKDKTKDEMGNFYAYTRHCNKMSHY